MTSSFSPAGWIVALGLIFLGLVHPLWSIADCAVTEEHSKSKKITWIILMVLTWYLSSIFYGIFATRSRNLRIATLGSIVLVAASLTIFIRANLAETSTSKPKTTKKSVAKKHNKSKVRKSK